MDSDEFLRDWLRYERLLTRKAQRYFPDGDTAADAVQETFLRVYCKRGAICDGNHLVRYAFLTLHNYYVDVQRERIRELDYFSQYGPPEEQEDCVAERKVLIREVSDAAYNASPKDRQVIDAFCRRNSLVEESQRTGVPVTTIRSREQAAFRRIRKRLGLNGDR